MNNPTLKIDTLNCIFKGTYGTIQNGELNFGGLKHEVVFKSPNIDSKEEFLNEIEIFSRNLNHENIITNFGYLKCFNNGFIILEKGHNDNLNDMLIKPKIYKINDALKMDYSLQIAKGMKYLHDECNIIHRDLKPMNIVLGSDKLLKICDFGCASYQCKSINLLVGTAGYVAPEVIIDEKILQPKKIDVFSYGIVLWEIWSRKLPYNSDCYKDGIDLIEKVYHGLRPNIKEVKNSPNFIIELIKDCWNFKSSERPSFMKICKIFEYNKNIS